MVPLLLTSTCWYPIHKSSALVDLDAEDLRELIDDDGGMKSIDDRELEKADGDDANVNGTGF